MCRKAASADFSFAGWLTGKIRRNHLELTHSHHNSSMSTFLYRKFCKTTQIYSSTNLGWLNIHRPKYEIHTYKENLLYVNTFTKKNR